MEKRSIVMALCLACLAGAWLLALLGFGCSVVTIATNDAHAYRGALLQSITFAAMSALLFVSALVLDRRLIVWLLALPGFVVVALIAYGFTERAPYVLN